MTRTSKAYTLGAAVLALMPVCQMWPVPQREARVHAPFDLDSPAGGPFPSNRFTVAGPGQLTGLRVQLPAPDCGTFPTDCEDIEVINTLDGFNLQPRVSIPFDGPIDPGSVSSRTVLLVDLGNTTGPPESRGRLIGINQIV